MSGLRDIIVQLLRFGLYAGVHVLLVSRLVLFDLGWCFFYLGFLLFLPLRTPIVVQLLLILLHHAAFFVLELGSFRHFGTTLGKILMSALFTTVALLIVQLLFYPVRRGRQ